MALNNSGPLSFGGATVGQSINLELGLSATAQASINSTSFRTLAGVASGQISINNFYGKSNASYFVAYYGSYVGDMEGACTDSSGTYCAVSEQSGTNMNLLQISSTGTFTRWNYYGGGQRGASPVTVGNTLYYGFRNANVTPGQVGVTSINTSTGAVISTGATAKSGGTSTVTQYGTVGVDSSGNMFMGGYYNIGGTNNSVLAAYNSSGVYQGDTKPSSIGAAAFIPGIAVDSSNNVYCMEVGSTGGACYIVKMSYSGGTFTKVWTMYFGGSGSFNVDRWCRWVTVRGSYVYVCITPGGSPVATYVYKLNASDGSLVWGRYLNSSNNQNKATGISVDSSDNVYVFGYARTVYPETYTRPYVVKLNSSGTTQFIREFYTSSTTISWLTGANSADDNGNMCFSMTDYTVNYFMKMPTDGSKTGSYSVGGTTLIYAATTGVGVTTYNAGIVSTSNGGTSYGLSTASTSASAASLGITPTIAIVP